MRSLAQPRRRSFGPLRAVEFSASAEAPVIVCLHGYGADANDLAPLAAEADLAGPARWVFPDAPLAMGPAPIVPGRAWFPIDEGEMMRAQMEGRTLDVSQGRPEGLDSALEAVKGFLGALEVPASRLVLGGFSQGAMVALEAALRGPEAPRGLFLLSSTLCDRRTLETLAPGRAGLAFFQSHGRYDPLLGYRPAMALRELLEAAGLKGTFLAFEGGHAVPPEALQGLVRYLDSLDAPPA